MPLTLFKSRLAAAAAPSEGRPGTLRGLLGHPSVFLFVILTAQLMVVLDATIVNVALPNIQRGLGFSGSGLSWVINAYILTFGGLLLLGARAGDLLGRRRVFLTGIAIFSMSSLVGGLAVSGWMLLAARAVQGIGAALAAPSALSLLTTVFADGPARLRAIGLYTTVSAAGGAMGLVAGGLLTELVSWRWVMFVNVPIGVAVWLLGRVVIVETERRRGRFDLAGALTSTLGMGGIVFGLIQAGTDGWTAPVTVASFVIGISLLGLFVHNERKVEEPILPLRLLRSATRSVANASRGLVYAGMYGMFFFMSLFFQDVQHYSPLRAGIAFLPLPAAVFLSSQLTSRVLSGRLPQKVVMMLGISLAALSLLLATRVQAGSPYAQILVPLVLLGMGSGICFVSLTSASLADVEPADAGAASGLTNVAQQLGAALGLAVLVSVFGVTTRHAQIGAQVSPANLARADGLLVHGLHEVFGAGSVFIIAALVTVAVFIRPAPARAPTMAVEMEVAELDEDLSLLTERQDEVVAAAS
ncbi:MAG: MFS transporter [Acidimicrobiales bacterium]